MAKINQTNNLNLLNIFTAIEGLEAEDDKDSSHRIIHPIFDDCIAILEKSGEIDTCREIFNIWITTLPPLPVWLSYIYFELRHGDVDKAQARAIFEKLVLYLPTPSSWIHYAEFEYNYGSWLGVRICGERAISNLKEKEGLEELLLALAQFEEQCNELENSTRLYKSVLDNCNGSKFMYKKILDFVQRHGEKKGFVKKLLLDRRDYFESLININPLNHAVWWDYIHMLEETCKDENSIRLLYKRALENVPKIKVKSYWKKYVYLWILYALFEEIDAGDIDRARQAYKDCIMLIPHEKFSFSKIWLYAAIFEIKQLQVVNMREIFDSAIGIVPKEKILNKYLDIEGNLGNVEQCRKLYTKLVQCSKDDCYEAWIKCAEFEASINEIVRARFIFELAVSQPALHDSKILWEAYTDFEISVGEISLTRKLHNKILRQKFNHLNVLISLAKFEAYGVQEILKRQDRGHSDYMIIESRCLEEARQVFYKGLEYNGCFDQNRKLMYESEKNQIVLVDEWLEMERRFGDLGDCGMVYDKLPWRLKLKLIQDDDRIYIQDDDGIYLGI